MQQKNFFASPAPSVSSFSLSGSGAPDDTSMSPLHSRLDIQYELIKKVQQEVQELKSQSTAPRSDSVTRSEPQISDFSKLGSADELAEKKQLVLTDEQLHAVCKVTETSLKQQLDAKDSFIAIKDQVIFSLQTQLVEAKERETRLDKEKTEIRAQFNRLFDQFIPYLPEDQQKAASVAKEHMSTQGDPVAEADNQMQNKNSPGLQMTSQQQQEYDENQELEAQVPMQVDSDIESIPEIRIDCLKNSNNMEDRSCHQAKIKTKIADYPQLTRVAAEVTKRTQQHQQQAHKLGQSAASLRPTRSKAQHRVSSQPLTTLAKEESKQDQVNDTESDVSMIDTTNRNYTNQDNIPAMAVTGPVGLADGTTVYGINTNRSNLKKQKLQTSNEYNLFDGALEQPGLYRSRWKDLKQEADKVYVNPQSVQQQVNLMNLKRRAKSTSLDRSAARQAKRDNGVPLTLEEKRAEQEGNIKSQFQSSKDVTLKTEAWLKSLAQCQDDEDFEKLGDPICDAIILPECPLFFGTGQDRFSKMKVFLLEYKVPVQHVCEAARDGCVFVQLFDSNNKFTDELLEKLKAALDGLCKDVRAALKKQKKKEEYIEEEVDKIHIKQIDYTQDLIGFFMSLNPKIFDDLRDLGKLLKMHHSTEYTQLRTSFQFVEECIVDDKKIMTNRLKIYNKLVHLWTSGQFKKWLNMNTHKIFNAYQAFYFDKILPGMIEGLSRIEHSLYFHNKADQDEILFDTKCDFTKKLIDPVVAALNKMKNKFRYKVPFPTFVESYFRAAATKSVLVSFEQDLWAIAYSYSERSYCFTGHLVNRTKHSGTMLDFIKKHVPDGANMRIFINGKVHDNVQKRGRLMKLPISSLNEQHVEQYNFKLDPWYKYLLSKYDLDTIQIICDDIQLLLILGIAQPAQPSKRELKRSEKEKKQQGMLVEHLLEKVRTGDHNYYKYKDSTTNSQCIFKALDKAGRRYHCDHCSKCLQRRGKGGGNLYLI